MGPLKKEKNTQHASRKGEGCMHLWASTEMFATAQYSRYSIVFLSESILDREGGQKLQCLGRHI